MSKAWANYQNANRRLEVTGNEAEERRRVIVRALLALPDQEGRIVRALLALPDQERYWRCRIRRVGSLALPDQEGRYWRCRIRRGAIGAAGSGG